MANIAEKKVSDRKIEMSGLLIEKTARLFKLSFARLLMLHPEIDITVDQWVIIQLLYKHKTLSQQDIAELAFKDAPTVTRMIDLLETKVYLKRNPDPADRRKFIISLSPHGEEIYHMVLPILQEFRVESYAGLTHEDLSALEYILNKIFSNLSKSN
jgi:DNA-binding MarR family transcriptional regulator